MSQTVQSQHRNYRSYTPFIFRYRMALPSGATLGKRKRLLSLVRFQRTSYSLGTMGMALREKALAVPAKVGSCVRLDVQEMVQLHLLLHKIMAGFEQEASGD